MPGKLSRTDSSAIPAPVSIIVTLHSRLQNPDERVHQSDSLLLKSDPIVPVRQLGQPAWACWFHAAAMILRVVKLPGKIRMKCPSRTERNLKPPRPVYLSCRELPVQPVRAFRTEYMAHPDTQSVDPLPPVFPASDDQHDYPIQILDRSDQIILKR